MHKGNHFFAIISPLIQVTKTTPTHYQPRPLQHLKKKKKKTLLQQLRNKAKIRPKHNLTLTKANESYNSTSKLELISPNEKKRVAKNGK